MSILRVVLHDQLSHSISSLDNIGENDVVMICEQYTYFTHVEHHKKKIAFIISAMRHFAKELKNKNIAVHYLEIDDADNSSDLYTERKKALKKYKLSTVVITHPSEYHILEEIKNIQNKLNKEIDIRPDNRFLSTQQQFKNWSNDRKQLRMEYFYREMRKQYSVLMHDNKPIGGKWNYDAENRKVPKSGIRIPNSHKCQPNKLTKDVMSLVEDMFPENFGSITPFYFAVTRRQALNVLDNFIEERLQYFGDYQDAMLEGEPWMYHSHISFYLNIGLLLPLECINAAENAYHQGRCPLNAVEGFIRQILGWREYVYGIYWLKMPAYKELNFFNSKRSLPDFYWTANTHMNCLHQCVKETQENAYAHHIQRLMVLGNFSLLTGVSPKYINEWFWIVYADAYEWVELPNVSGMVLFADGGLLASKPYAAGGAYINKMSDYCKSCKYKVSLKQGNSACPFNYLYWNFLITNRKKLESNPRIGMMYKTLGRMSREKILQIKEDSNRFLEKLDSQEIV